MNNTQTLPMQIQEELRDYPALHGVISMCFDNDSFVKAFEKLTSIKMPKPSKSALEYLIDKSTNYQDSATNHFLHKFIEFIYTYVWLTAPNLDQLKQFQPQLDQPA